MSLLLSFYGDDFTGSSAVMEVLSFAGISTMLFVEAPEPDVLQRYPNLQAIGVAGVARSKTPDWMRRTLPDSFARLNALGAPLLHYKVCSTFDSAPEVGSIGVATEIGAEVCGADWVPLVLGAPALQRYQVFGQLFAGIAGDSRVHRLDRHPIMSRHPVTPMDEADLGRHLAKQTDLGIGVVDLAAMKSGCSDAALQEAQSQGARIVALDALDDETLAEAGRLIWQDGQGPRFAVGSQGVEYALVSHWRESGAVATTTLAPRPTRVDQVFGVSGSCSATTAAQIDHAAQNGFAIVAFDATTVVDADRLEAERDRVESLCLRTLSEGRDVLVVTARGPDDPAIEALMRALDETGVDPQYANERLGQALGQLLLAIRRKTGLPRMIVSGGDTSGHALTTLEIEALSAVAPLAPGAPLCRLHSHRQPKVDGLEVTLKGGQMGAESFFTDAKGIGT